MILFKDKKGNTLLIVVVATFVLLSIVLYLNKFVLNQIKISNDISKLKTSEYAAESGIERVLYLIRKNNIPLSTILTNNSYNTAVLNNDSAYKIIADTSGSADVIIPTILRNATYSLNITNYLTTIRSFRISWTSSGNETLNVSIARYRNNVLEGYNFRQSYNHFLDSPLVVNINISPRTGRVYNLELNPVSYDVNNVVLTFYSGANATGNYVNVLPNQPQRIKSVGNINSNNKSVISDFLINSQY